MGRTFRGEYFSKGSIFDESTFRRGVLFEGNKLGFRRGALFEGYKLGFRGGVLFKGSIFRGKYHFLDSEFKGSTYSKERFSLRKALVTLRGHSSGCRWVLLLLLRRCRLVVTSCVRHWRWLIRVLLLK